MASAQGNAGGFKILMTVEPNEPAHGNAAGTGPTCVIQYGSESLVVPANGRTVRQLFDDNAESLSFERNRSVVFRSNGSVVNGDSTAQAGRTYAASVSFEQKGR